MKKLLFILNPRSGKAQIRNKLLDILDIFIKEGYQVMVHVTQKSMDAKDMAVRYGGDADLIVCSGGDGTLNEVISGMAELPNSPALGYIPSGSTNDFASSLKISRHMLTAAMDAVQGEKYSIDIGSFCEDKFFVYIAGFGAFTEVAYLTPQDKKNLLGHQAYMIEAVKRLAALKSYHMNVQWKDNEIEGDFLFGMVTNTISVGGFKGLVDQNAALNDGEFEVLLIRMPKTPLDFSNIVSYLFLKEEQNEYVHKFKTRSLRFYSENPVDWVLDGEFGGSKSQVEIVNLQERIEIKRNLMKKR